MTIHKEISFEDDVCAHLAANGWLCEAGDGARYDRARALFPADVIAWVQATQPDAWATLAKQNGVAADETLLARLRDQITQRGTLDVLRHGIELLGLKKPLQIAQFKPALAINPASSRATRPTGCASCGRSGIRCTAKTASIWFCSLTEYRSLLLS